MILLYMDYTNDSKNDDFILLQYSQQWIFINPNNANSVISKSNNKANVLSARYYYYLNLYTKELTTLYNDLIVALPLKVLMDNIDLTQQYLKKADIILQDFNLVNLNNDEYQARQANFNKCLGNLSATPPIYSIDFALNDNNTILEIKDKLLMPQYPLKLKAYRIDTGLSGDNDYFTIADFDALVEKFTNEDFINSYEGDNAIYIQDSNYKSLKYLVGKYGNN